MFIPTLKEIVRQHKPDIIIILEPCISGRRADQVCRNITGYKNKRIEARGFSEGIWFLWKNDGEENLSFPSLHDQAMHYEISFGCNR